MAWRPAAQMLSLVDIHPPDEGSDNLPHDLVLHHRQIVERTIIVFRPNVIARARINQLCGDPDAFSHTANAAFDQELYIEFVGRLPDVDGHAKEAKAGVARGDGDRAPARQIRDDVLSDPVGEIILLRVGRHIGERQDSHVHLRACVEMRGAVACWFARRREGCRQVQQVTALRRGLQHRAKVVLECAANFVDALHEAVVGYDQPRPNRIHQLVLGDEPARALGHIAQHRERLRPKRNGLSRFRA